MLLDFRKATLEKRQQEQQKRADNRIKAGFTCPLFRHFQKSSEAFFLSLARCGWLLACILPSDLREQAELKRLAEDKHEEELARDSVSVLLSQDSWRGME